MADFEYTLNDRVKAKLANLGADGTLTITDNGTVNIATYAYVDVNVETLEPEGSTVVVTNGIYNDLYTYETVDVQVPQPTLSMNTVVTFSDDNPSATLDVTDYKTVVITPEPKGSSTVVAENGTRNDLYTFETVTIAVPASAVVSGTETITSNQEGINVSTLAYVNVRVPEPEGYLTITVNGGSIDVKQYAMVDVGVFNQDPCQIVSYTETADYTSYNNITYHRSSKQEGYGVFWPHNRMYGLLSEAELDAGITTPHFYEIYETHIIEYPYNQRIYVYNRADVEAGKLDPVSVYYFIYSTESDSPAFLCDEVKTITANETGIDVSAYRTVNVNVPGPTAVLSETCYFSKATPAITLEVEDYAAAIITPKPKGEKITVTTNDDYNNLYQYETVTVNVIDETPYKFVIGSSSPVELTHAYYLGLLEGTSSKGAFAPKDGFAIRTKDDPALHDTTVYYDTDQRLYVCHLDGGDPVESFVFMHQDTEFDEVFRWDSGGSYTSIYAALKDLGNRDHIYYNTNPDDPESDWEYVDNSSDLYAYSTGSLTATTIDTALYDYIVGASGPNVAFMNYDDNTIGWSTIYKDNLYKYTDSDLEQCTDACSALGLVGDVCKVYYYDNNTWAEANDVLDIVKDAYFFDNTYVMYIDDNGGVLTTTSLDDGKKYEFTAGGGFNEYTPSQYESAVDALADLGSPSCTYHYDTQADEEEGTWVEYSSLDSLVYAEYFATDDSQNQQYTVLFRDPDNSGDIWQDWVYGNSYYYFNTGTRYFESFSPQDVLNNATVEGDTSITIKVYADLYSELTPNSNSILDARVDANANGGDASGSLYIVNNTFGASLNADFYANTEPESYSSPITVSDLLYSYSSDVDPALIWVDGNSSWGALEMTGGEEDAIRFAIMTGKWDADNENYDVSVATSNDHTVNSVVYDDLSQHPAFSSDDIIRVGDKYFYLVEVTAYDE